MTDFCLWPESSVTIPELPVTFVRNEAEFALELTSSLLDFSRNRWTRNRAQAGLQFQAGADARLQVYYMRQNATFGMPNRLNVLGLTIQIDIR